MQPPSRFSSKPPPLHKAQEGEVTAPEPQSEAKDKGKLPVAEQKIAELETQLAEMKNNYLRACADLENYKRRAAKDREEMVTAMSERLLRELVEVKDHLEMALEHSKDAVEVKPLHDGVTLTLKQMAQFLEKFGVTELNSLGEKFDPAFHEAIHEEESADVQPGSVVKEYQKGYLYQGRLLRAARVAVAKGTKS